MKLKRRRFLWVRMQIDNLCDSRRIKIEGDLVDELSRLPRSLADLYSSILKNIEQIEQRGRTIAETALKWLLCSTDASSEVIIVACSETNLDEPRSLSISDILDVCSTLVVYDESLDRFRFAHLSVREFLESQQGYTPSEANGSILEKLLQTIIRSQSPGGAFWSYAILYWVSHYDRLGESHRKAFFDRHAKYFLFNGVEPSDAFQLWTIEAFDLSFPWKPKFLPEKFKYYRYRYDFDSPINLGSCLGWLEILEYFHASQSPARFHDCAMDMMGIAIEYHQIPVISWLLLRNISPTDGLLQMACSEPSDIMQMFLEMKIVSFNTIVNGQEILVLIVRRGLWDLYHYCVQKGGNKNFRDQNGRTLLSHAVSKYRYKIFQDLLLAGADTMTQDKAGRTPTMLSISAQNEYRSYRSYMLLLTDPPCENLEMDYGDEFPPDMLQIAYYHATCLINYYGLESMLEEEGLRAELTQILELIARLLGHQSDASASSIQKFTKLSDGSRDRIQLIGQMLLSLAAFFRHEKAFQVLRDCGIDPVCLDIGETQYKASTVTQIYCARREQETMDPEYERDIKKLSDELKQGPLAWAAYTGNLPLVLSILSRGLDPSIKNRKGQTALYFAVQEYKGRNQPDCLETKKEAILRLLIQRGALVTSADAYGGTSLLTHAFKARYSKIAKLLVESGVEVPKAAIDMRVKRLLDAFDQSEEETRQALLKRVRGAQENTSDVQRSSTNGSGSGDPLDICARLIRGGMMRVLGDETRISK